MQGGRKVDLRRDSSRQRRCVGIWVLRAPIGARVRVTPKWKGLKCMHLLCGTASSGEGGEMKPNLVEGMGNQYLGRDSRDAREAFKH